MSNEKVYLLSEQDLNLVRNALERMWLETEDHTYRYNEAEDIILNIFDSLKELKDEQREGLPPV